MAPSISYNSIGWYLTFCTYSFYNVIATSPCDLGQLPFKLQSRDIFPVGKSATNRPMVQEKVSITVNLSLSIIDISVFDIKSLDVEIHLEMTEKWYDHRLGPDYKTRKLAVLGGIWQPKLSFVVGNQCSNIPATAANYEQTQFWRGTSNGSVFYNERFFVKPKCTKDLTNYPFDSQTCTLKIGSYRFTADEVNLEWSVDESPVELRTEKELGEFRIEKLKTYNEIDDRSAGNFSVLVLEIHISRYSRREIIQSFIPSFILLKISYGVFWMKLSEIRTRILTCQISLIGTLFVFTNSNNHNIFPNLTYLKALDIWFMICIVLGLVPLAESILIHYFHADENLESESESEDAEQELKSSGKITVWADKILRLIHPITFLSCTILFIAVFKYDTNDDDH